MTKKKEFKPIKIEDRELVDEIDRLGNERAGILVVISQLTRRMGEVQYLINRWFDKVSKKYNIPKERWLSLDYNHVTQEITFLTSYREKLGYMHKEDKFPSEDKK